MSGGDLLARYDAAENLTDRLAALRLLVHFGLDGADEALARFEERYRDNPLVLDKWFTVQATAPTPRRARSGRGADPRTRPSRSRTRTASMR